MVQSYRRDYERPPLGRTDLDLEVTNPNAGAGPQRTTYSGTSGPSATGNPLIDDAYNTTKPKFRAVKVQGDPDIWGNYPAPDVTITGEAQLPDLDFRATEGAISNANMYHGSAQAARMYRNPYEQKLEQGAGWNPIINRGVGARGIVGEQRQAQREGRTADPIMGRTATYTEDPNAPVDVRPSARTPTEAAFWENQDRINESWLRGDYQPVGPGSGSLNQQGKLDQAAPVMPPRLQRRQQVGSRDANNKIEYENGFAEHDLPEDLIWEEAWEATGGGKNAEIAQWLYSEKGMDVQTANSVAFMREFEQLEFAIQRINGGPIVNKGFEFKEFEAPEREDRNYEGWERLPESDRTALRQLIEQQRATTSAYFKSLNVMGDYPESRTSAQVKSKGKIDNSAWRQDLERYL